MTPQAVRDLLVDRRSLLTFGTEHGWPRRFWMPATVLLKAAAVDGAYNHLLVRGAVAITLDGCSATVARAFFTARLAARCNALC